MYARKIFAILAIFALTTGFVNYRMMPDNLSSSDSGGAAVASGPGVAEPVPALVASHASSQANWQTVRKAQNVIADLQKKLKSSLARPARVQMVRSALEQIAEIRRQSGVMELDKEVYLDFMTDPLASFFGEDYRPEKCASYEHIIMRDYEPSAAADRGNGDEGGALGAGREPAMVPQNPPIRKAFDVVAAVCR